MQSPILTECFEWRYVCSHQYLQNVLSGGTYVCSHQYLQNVLSSDQCSEWRYVVTSTYRMY